jgi:hypothetical protein
MKPFHVPYPEATLRWTTRIRQEIRLPTAILGMFLICAPFWTANAAAESPLLRGPRKAVRTNAAMSATPGEGQGLLQRIAAAPVLFYQRLLSPHWGRRCAYHPSCSNYALQAIRRHGVLMGSMMTFDRLQHEADETRYAPLIRIDGQIKFYDPVENNDFWRPVTDRSAKGSP